MWNSRPIASSVLRGVTAGALAFVVLCAADLLIIVILRQFVEGQAVFGVIFVGILLLAVSAIVAFVFGVYVGRQRYREMKQARAEASKTYSS